MSRASNSLTVSDVIVTPIKLKYTASYDQCTINEYGITVLTGINGPVTITGSVPQETLNYRSVKQLYYANTLTGSYLTTTSSFDVSLQSTAASGTFDSDNRYFPTESGAQVRILSIPRGVFGQQISRHSFLMSSSLYSIADDGNGNLYDSRFNQPYVEAGYFTPDPQPPTVDSYTYPGVDIIHVGNILYAQGMVIITNPNYLDIFPYPPTAANDYATFLTTDSPKTVNILANDDPGTGTLIPTSVFLFSGSVGLFTNNLDGTVTLNTTTPGFYQTYYTVQSAIPGGCPLTSNSASINVTVDPVCNFEVVLLNPYTTTSTTTSTTTLVPTTTSTTTSTTTQAPTTTSTTTSTTTEIPTTTTSTTTSTTTEVPTTTSTTTSTTTQVPTTTSTTTSTTTEVPTTTSTTTSTTTEIPTTTSTTTSTTTEVPTTTSTTTSTTTEVPTTTSTTTSTTTIALVDVLITACGSQNADGSGNVNLFVYSSVATDTNVDVTVRWIGDLSSTIQETLTILSGTSCNSGTFGGATSLENNSSFEILTVAPSSSSTQNYTISGVTVSNSCTTC